MVDRCSLERLKHTDALWTLMLSSLVRVAITIGKLLNFIQALFIK